VKKKIPKIQKTKNKIKNKAKIAKKSKKPKIAKKNPTKSPDYLYNINEQDFLTAIDNITKNLAYKFKFGYHDIDDMKQQITLFALEGIKNYDHKRPLENFLWTHVRNRLFNYKRDNYQRPNKPCLTCPLYDPNLKQSTSGCSQFSNKNDCELYSKWSDRNNAKKNLAHFAPIEEVKDYGNLFHDITSDSSSSIAAQEIINLIEQSLNGTKRNISQN
jgi:hypothetical protein